MSSSTPQVDADASAQTQSEHARTPTPSSSTNNNPAATTTCNPAETTTTNPASNTPSSTAQPAQVTKNNNNNNDDDDSDFDELDDVLDNFNKPAASTTQPPTSSASATKDANATTEDVDLDEEAFLKQLEKDMANLMGAGAGGDASESIPEGFGDEESLDKDAEMFAKLLEEGGVSAEDFLKQLVGDMMKGEAGKGMGSGSGSGSGSSGGSGGKKKKSKSKKKGSGGGATAGEASATKSTTDAAAADAAAAAATPETFNDTIQRTIERMKESGDKATAAVEEEDGDADDLVAQLIKAIETGAGGAGGDGDDADLTKMFQGMMEQLSNKEILYEPMKELDTKFGPWLAENKASGAVSAEELLRYETQAAVVAQIVAKFEDPGYTDEDPKCREYVWEKMQEMQACGNPPDELIPAPMMEDLMGGGAGAGAGAPDCPQQ